MIWLVGLIIYHMEWTMPICHSCKFIDGTLCLCAINEPCPDCWMFLRHELLTNVTIPSNGMKNQSFVSARVGLVDLIIRKFSTEPLVSVSESRVYWSLIKSYVNRTSIPIYPSCNMSCFWNGFLKLASKKCLPMSGYTLMAKWQSNNQHLIGSHFLKDFVSELETVTLYQIVGGCWLMRWRTVITEMTAVFATMLLVMFPNDENHNTVICLKFWCE